MPSYPSSRRKNRQDIEGNDHDKHRFFPGLGLEFELNRVAFTVLGHNIYWYGVIIAAGFLLAVIYGLHIAPRFGMDPDKITDAIFVVVPMAILGARMYYVIFNPAVCFQADGSFSLLRMIAFWDGGWPSTAAL